MVVSNFVTRSNTLKFDDVVGVILSKEMQRKSIGETSGNVLTMESKGRQNERGRSRGNHGKYKKGRFKSRFKKIEGVMSALGKLYEKSSASNKVLLMKCLFNMNILEGVSVADHLNEFNTLTSQLSSIKVKFDDEVRALIILCSFPGS